VISCLQKINLTIANGVNNPMLLIEATRPTPSQIVFYWNMPHQASVGGRHATIDPPPDNHQDSCDN
jgi:hypothetical protein